MPCIEKDQNNKRECREDDAIHDDRLLHTDIRKKHKWCHYTSHKRSNRREEEELPDDDRLILAMYELREEWYRLTREEYREYK